MDWLDYVPGARQAYEFVVAKISEFNLIGLRDIPRRQSILNSLAPRVQASGDPALGNQLEFAREATEELKSNWLSVDEKVRSVLSQIKSLGLGAVPVAALIALAGAVITVSTAMYLFFRRAENQARIVNEFVNDMVSRGLLSPDEAAKLLAGGGGFLEGLGGGLTAVALVAAVMYLLPRRRRA